MPNSELMDIIVRLQDLASREVKEITRELTRMNKITLTAGKSFTFLTGRAKALTSSIFSLKGMIVGFGAGLVAKGFLDVASSFEDMQIQLDVLTKGKGKQTLEELNQWALKMPVNTQEAVASFVRMKAMGLDPTIDKLETLVNVASIFGDDVLSRVSRQLGQMAASARVSAEDLNTIAETGLNVRKYLTDAFGSVEDLQKKIRDGSVTAKQAIDVIWKGMAEEYAGAAEKAQNTWRGLWNTFISFLVEIQRRVMGAGVFEALKNTLRDINVQIENWMNNNLDLIAQNIPVYIEKIKAGVEKLWTTMKKLYDLFTKLPEDIVGIAGYGILGRILWGGPQGFLLAAFAVGKKIGDLINKSSTAVTPLMKQLQEEAAQTQRDIEAAMKFRMNPQNIAYLEGLQDKLNLINDKIALLKKKQEEKIIDKIIPDEAPKKMELFEKTIEKVTQISTKGLKDLSAEAKAAGELSEFRAAQETVVMALDQLYSKGLTSFEDYWRERRRITFENYEAEKKALETQVAAADPTKDPDKLRALNAQIFALEEQHKRDILQLDIDEQKNRDKIKEDAKTVQETLTAARLRAQTETDQGLTAQFQKELSDMQTRQEAEIQSLTDHNAKKEELEDIRRSHELEKETLLADQKKRLQDSVLANAQKSLGFMEDAFGSMYEATGKKHKEWARAQRATQIAMTVISTYQAAVEAYKSALTIPVIGTYLAPVAAAAAIVAGMAKVAAMRATPLGEGGKVPGYSPTKKADNIPIWATAGEFMQPVSAVQKYGLGAMEAIRSGKVPPQLLRQFNLKGYKTPSGFRMAAGGAVPSSVEGSDIGTAPAAASPVNIINVLDPGEFDQYLWSPQGQDSIVNIVTSNQERIRRLRE